MKHDLNQGQGKQIHISKSELINHGCRNCVWKLHKQCPHGLTEPNEFYEFHLSKSGKVIQTDKKRKETKPEIKSPLEEAKGNPKIDQADESKDTESSTIESGYCPEYLDFILSLAEADDSVSAMWEKFSLYVARLQSSEDYKEYIQLCDKVTMMKAENIPYKDRAEYEIQKETLRLWWERLNDSIRKGYGRIVDREKKSDNVLTIEHHIPLSQIHQLMNTAKTTQLENKGDEQ